MLETGRDSSVKAASPALSFTTLPTSCLDLQKICWNYDKSTVKVAGLAQNSGGGVGRREKFRKLSFIIKSNFLQEIILM
jgi:hypothetical protein